MYHIFVGYDEGPNGDYMAEATRLADELEIQGYSDVTVNDLGYGADVVYGDIVM